MGSRLLSYFPSRFAAQTLPAAQPTEPERWPPLTKVPQFAPAQTDAKSGCSTPSAHAQNSVGRYAGRGVPNGAVLSLMWPNKTEKAGGDFRKEPNRLPYSKRPA
jgi:hypothetical protein